MVEIHPKFNFRTSRQPPNQISTFPTRSPTFSTPSATSQHTYISSSKPLFVNHILCKGGEESPLNHINFDYISYHKFKIPTKKWSCITKLKPLAFIYKRFEDKWPKNDQATTISVQTSRFSWTSAFDWGWNVWQLTPIFFS